MPLADYRCPTCQRVSVDNLYASSDGPYLKAPLCFGIPEHPPVKMEWIPQIGRMDCAGGTEQGGFKEFDTYVKGPDGVDRLTHVSNLSDLRRIERETEAHWKNGLGQPLRWRDWSQDQSNSDVNLFGKSPGELVRAELEEAQRDLKGRRDHLRTLRGEEARKAGDVLGPGVTESTASPLETIDFTPKGE